jgi:uncharacterized HAD superfamily protein
VLPKKQILGLADHRCDHSGNHWLCCDEFDSLDYGDHLEAPLQTLLNVERNMLEKWLNQQETNAATLANDRRIRIQLEKWIDESNR